MDYDLWVYFKKMIHHVCLQKMMIKVWSRDLSPVDWGLKRQKHTKLSAVVSVNLHVKHISEIGYWLPNINPYSVKSLFGDCDEERKHLLAGAQVTQFAGSKQESNFTDN